MNYKDQIKDYLITALETFDINDEEKKELLEYIEEIAQKSSSLYSFIEKDENKEKVIALIESMVDKKDV